MIAKFNFTREDHNKLVIEYITGKVNKFYLQETFLDNTSDVHLMNMYMNVGGEDYNLLKVVNLIIYTNKGSVLTISHSITRNWEINGNSFNDKEFLDKLNELYVAENIKET